MGSTDRKSVLCVACRETYVPSASATIGCPHCGGLSWIAAWLAHEPRDTPPPHAA